MAAAAARMTEYERKRVENIKRNEEMLASLNVHSKLDQLSSASKRLKAQHKSYKVSPTKKVKSESPIVVTRRSLRARGLQPDASTASGLKDDYYETPKKGPIAKLSLFHPGPNSFTTKEAYFGESSDIKLKETILRVCVDKKSNCETSATAFVDTESDCKHGVSGQVDLCSFKLGPENVARVCVDKKSNCETGAFVDTKSDFKNRVSGRVDLCSFKLGPENVARVVPGRIMTTKFLPSADVAMIVVGNKTGNVGFWDVNNAGKEDGDGIYLYRPHSGPVSGIAVQPFDLSKIYTSCYDGYIRMMDVEKELFDLVYSSDHPVFSMTHRQSDANSLYFSEGNGLFNIWDKREGKVSTLLHLHGSRINSLDFNPQNTNIMATSSTDGTACIWDLRKLDAKDPEALGTVNHKRAVHSAYFSPSGTCLATTSFDDKVGLITGPNFEDVNMITHYNQTGRWISSFRAIWGWDDSYIFIGNMKRGVDVISTAQKRNVATLQSEYMSAIPCRFDAHPYNIGMLAGATSGGQVYVWTI